jgi:hypothetical protein
MTAPSKDSWISDAFRPAGTMRKPGTIYNPYPDWLVLKRVRLETTNTVGMCEPVEFTNAAGDDSDLEACVLGASDSTVTLGYIPDTEWNRMMMAKGNNVDYCTDALKATGMFQFTTDAPDGGAWVDMLIMMPGMVLSFKAANSTTIKPGYIAYCAGTNKVDCTATGHPLGKIAGQIVSEAALHWVSVIVGLAAS